MEDATRMPRFVLVTLGCAKNEVDSDRMRALLLSQGFEETDDAQAADVALVNTCSFLVSATSESIEATLELAEARAEGTRTKPIVMCGCVPSRYGSELAPELPEVAAFVRADEEDGIVEVVRGVLAGSEPETAPEAEESSLRGGDRFKPPLREDSSAPGDQSKLQAGAQSSCAEAGLKRSLAAAEEFCAPSGGLQVQDAEEVPAAESADERVGGVGDGARVLRTVEGASAYVKISDGCDRFCTFCAIPYIRGRYQSRPADEIVAEVAALAAGGVREVVLIGQDTGVWGTDFDEPETLASLLVRVAEVMRPYDGWVRVLYLQPEGMTDELIAVIRDTPEVLPYIDIPIQHCSEQVLANMGRSGSRAELARLFDRLRSEIPGMVLRTTGMCGFPGETDEQADELLDFVLEQEFDYTSVFTYSAEEGTAAAAFEEQVSEDVALERTQRLIDAAEALGFAATARHVGERVRVIVDGVEEGEDGLELIGHAWFQAPDSDGAVHIAEGEAAVGDIVTCELVDSVCYELYGEIVSEAVEGRTL